MREEEKIFKGILFSPGEQGLKNIKLRTHNLCSDNNRTFEDETEIYIKQPKLCLEGDIFWWG